MEVNTSHTHLRLGGYWLQIKSKAGLVYATFLYSTGLANFLYVILRIYHTHLDNEEAIFTLKREMLLGMVGLADIPALARSM